jgi:hypothetical protein
VLPSTGYCLGCLVLPSTGYCLVRTAHRNLVSSTCSICCHCLRFDSPADRQHIKQQRAAIWAWFRGLGGNLIK